MKKLLAAAFFAAFFLPGISAATDYYFETGQGAGACSEADPCSTVAHANAITPSPGDNLYFNCGDSFTDASLDTQANGSSGSPITYTQGGPTTCTGANDPIFGNSATLDNVASLLHDWNVFDGLAFTGGTQGGGGDDVLLITGAANSTVTNVTIVGNQGGTAGDCIRVQSGNTNLTIGPNVSVDDCNTSGINFSTSGTGVACNITVTDVTIGNAMAGGVQGDMFAAQNDECNGIDLIRVEFDGTAGENGFDIKSGGDWYMSEITTTRIPGAHLFHEGDGSGTQTVIVSEDSDWIGTGSGRYFQLSDDVIWTSNRDLFAPTAGVTGELIRCGDVAASDPTVNINAGAILVPAGSAWTETVILRRGCTGGMSNMTIIDLEGDNPLIQVDANYTGAGWSITNSILYTASTNFLLDSDVANPFTFDQNLCESASAGTWANINGTNYTEATIQSTLGACDETGDPLFASTTTTSNVFAFPLPGSPAIGLGSAGNLYTDAAVDGSRDFHGRKFNGTNPNVGAVSQAIAIKAEDAPPLPPAPPPTKPREFTLKRECECELTSLNWPTHYTQTCRCREVAVQ